MTRAVQFPLCLDALEPAGSTRGTEHTVGLARRARLTVTEMTWPRDAARGATT